MPVVNHFSMLLPDGLSDDNWYPRIRVLRGSIQYRWNCLIDHGPPKKGFFF